MITLSGQGKLAFVVSSLLGISMVLVILHFVGWTQIVKGLKTLGWKGFLVFFINVSLTFVFWFIAWWIILRSYGVKPSALAIIKSRLSGFAFSYLTPSMYLGGEPVQVYVISRNLKTPKTKLFATVFVQKILEGISLLLFICLGSFYALFSSKIPPSLKTNLIIINVFLGTLIILGAINFLRRFFWLARMVQFISRFLPWKEILTKAVAKIREMEIEIHKAVSQHAKATTIAFLSTMASTFFLYLRPQVFFYYSQKTLFSFPQLSLIFALNMVLASLFWITPGGLGIAEGGRIGIFALVGISQGGAVAFSFAVKAMELIFVGLGVISLFRFGTWLTMRRSQKKV